MITHLQATSSSSPAQYWLVKGQRALREGKHAPAVAAFRQAVVADPDHIEARMWLAAHCDDPRESLRHITHVLSLDAHHEAAHAGIRWARRKLAEREAVRATASARPSVPAAQPSTRRARAVSAQPLGFSRWAQLSIALCLMLSVVLSGAIIWALQLPIAYVNTAGSVVVEAVAEPAAPFELPEARLPARQRPPLSYAERADKIMREVDVVWAKQDWNYAAPLIAQAVAFRPNDTVLRRKLMAAYFNHAVNLLDEGELESALSTFDQALAVAPGDPQVQSERDTLANYITGLDLFNQRQWSDAAKLLAKVQSADAGYLDARGLLYRAYYHQGLELKAKKDLEGALKAFQSAVDLDNDAIEARGELAQVKAALRPPPPLPPGASGEKWIDVNLTTQRFRALQGQTVVYTFVTSTGQNGRPTAPGRYRILDKIPNAYSRFWHLWMPYWMGIYWVGASENGIHALPILSNGQKLWAGFLGRRVSFGCVILDTSAAKLMYDWADIGTPVVIHY